MIKTKLVYPRDNNQDQDPKMKPPEEVDLKSSSICFRNPSADVRSRLDGKRRNYVTYSKHNTGHTVHCILLNDELSSQTRFFIPLSNQNEMRAIETAPE
jgi:hypothetical protein